MRDEATRLGRIYLAFLADAQLSDGRFHNFMSYDRRWLDDVGSDDSCGRAIWSLGFGVRFAPLESWRELCAGLLSQALPSLPRLDYVRSRAYAALGLAHAREVGFAPAELDAALKALSEDFVLAYREGSRGEWHWFEDELTYDNARLCEAALRVGSVLGDTECTQAALEALDFLETVTFEGDRFVPIGNRGWYARGGERARFDQQPLEAAAMVEAEIAALAATGDGERLQKAAKSFSWYFGRNDVGESLVRDDGCCDGLSEQAVNQNMGAESTLAYLSSAFALAEAQVPVVAK